MDLALLNTVRLEFKISFKISFLDFLSDVKWDEPMINEVCNMRNRGRGVGAGKRGPGLCGQKTDRSSVSPHFFHSAPDLIPVARLVLCSLQQRKRRTTLDEG